MRRTALNWQKAGTESRFAFYQKDIRELQLAKSAVRAGLETLLLRYEISPEDVDKVYLAGGFGYRMDVEKAVGIGLIPEVFADKIRVIGSGALEGAVRYGRGKRALWIWPGIL